MAPYREFTDKLSLDYETYSDVDLKVVGTSRYARHKSTKVLLLAYAFNNGPKKIVRVAQGEKIPAKVIQALLDPDVKKCAWNASFEKAITRHVLGLDIKNDEWHDTMVMAMHLSFPGKLDKCGAAVGIPEDKKKLAIGKALIKLFCGKIKPTKKFPFTRATHETHPEKWEEFVQYCLGDVEAERTIYNILEKWDMPQSEWDLWFLDQEINEHGLPVNMDVVNNAVDIVKELTAKKIQQMKDLTGLDNPNSNQQILPWLKKHGYRFDDMKAGHVKTAVKEAEGKLLKKVLMLRQEVSKTSVKKYAALQAAMDADGYLRYTLQFNGAPRTHRWAGRRYQPHNLAKPEKYLEKYQEQAIRHLEKFSARQLEIIYEKPFDMLSMCVRPVMQPKPGFLFADADLNAIENRVVGWLANDQKILDVFRDGRDPYVDFATYMYEGTYEELYAEYKAGKKDKRTMAKPAVLGCAYMLGVGEWKENKSTGEIEGTGLLGYAKNMGVEMTKEQAEHAVKTFRKTYRRVTKFWKNIDKAMRQTIRTGKTTRVGFIEFEMTSNKYVKFCRMNLPNGTSIYYCNPRIENRRMPWGETRPAIVYDGLNDTGNWGPVTTHPGKITENAVQKVARDLLAHGMMLAKKAKQNIVLHVHDQIVTMVPMAEAAEHLKTLIACMAKVPKWAPGLILGAEGVVANAFYKD